MNYTTISQAISTLLDAAPANVPLAQLALQFDVSEAHFQKSFTAWVGLSPKQFSQLLARNHAKGLLEKGLSCLSASMAAGLSSPSRLHDLFISIDGMSPAQLRNLGAGLTIQYGVFETVLGHTAAAHTGMGLCLLIFAADGQTSADLLSQVTLRLSADWPAADRKSTRLNSSHRNTSRMPSSA